jgi:hypothetical protein
VIDPVARFCLRRNHSGQTRARKNAEADGSNDVGAPENRMIAQRAVLTPRLPQFITPVLEPERVRFGILTITASPICANKKTVAPA